MRVKKAGRVDEGLWLLGTEESCVYLLEGKRSAALISAGMSYILPDFFDQLDAWGISEDRIEHLIILHAHFDHVGLVPFLKRKWPHLTVYASARGWNVLANPKAIAVINDFTVMVCRRMRGRTDMLDSLDWQWRFDVQGETLREGSVIDLGDRVLEIYETPGHSSCSISAYAPQLRALFPSDAAAIPYREEYVVAAGSSFEKYGQSLDRMAGFDVKTLCADHYGCITGEEAAGYISESKAAADRMIDRLQAALRQEGSVASAARKLVALHYELRPDYFVHPEILLRTYTQMLRQFLPAGLT
ncbi:MAG: MBL fold metallo-hydrolase [Smithellaceae bacterium]|nr:MBL fold metallo-hydrolase [Smithellaceae bacterium]NLX51414.1 MBL fold metallo-hydrolase [Deltaproteobacteria bacterium]